MNGDDAFWERMHANFSDTEIGDVVLMCGTWLGVGHGLKALGIGSVCAVPASEETLRRLRNAEMSIRSEEHTSELQSLMRISYAVFCLKNKKTKKEKKQQ